MPGWELIGEEERNALLEWFDSSNGVMFAHGFDARRNGVYKVREFERAVAEKVDSPYGLAVASGSAALVVALRALGVGHGDEVVTQAFTFVATVEAILDTGATPVIAEVDDSLNLDPRALAAKLTDRTKAVIPVHMAGAPADLDAILQLARERGVKVLEDVAQAVGGSWRGRALGTLGDAGTFSFDFAKNLTTGEGGLVLTADEQVFLRARAVHDHGHELNPDFPRGRDTRSFPGFNYRMSEPEATIGLAQLGKLDFIVRRQRENKAALKERLAPLGLEFRRILDEGDVGDTLIFFLESEQQAAEAARRLGERGVGTKNLPDALDWHFAGTWEHMLPQTRGTGCACRSDGAACICGPLLRRAIALPVNVLMDDDELDRVAAAVEEAVR